MIDTSFYPDELLVAGLTREGLERFINSSQKMGAKVDSDEFREMMMMYLRVHAQYSGLSPLESPPESAYPYGDMRTRVSEMNRVFYNKQVGLPWMALSPEEKQKALGQLDGMKQITRDYGCKLVRQQDITDLAEGDFAYVSVLLFELGELNAPFQVGDTVTLQSESKVFVLEPIYEPLDVLQAIALFRVKKIEDKILHERL